MKKLIKRLEIIKSGIELEDDDIIRHQLPYLKGETQDAVLVFIVMAIEQGKFTHALEAISAWLGSKQGVTQWQDIELSACKLELKALEEQLSDLIDKRNERIQLLDDFNDLYLVRLGPLMKQILNLRKQLAESTLRKAEAEARRRERDYRNCQQYISQAIDELAALKQRWLELPSVSNESIEIRNRIQQQAELINALLTEIKELENTFCTRNTESTRKAREEAKEKYESYQEKQTDAEQRLNNDKKFSSHQRQELKRLWRQASRLCHPDLVADEFKEKAHQLMVQLNQARQRGDFPAIHALLESLKQGLEPLMASDLIDDLERLRRKIDEVRKQIDAILHELKALEGEESWRLATSLPDKDQWFTEQENVLSKTLNILERQVKEASTVLYEA
ncbi:TPA: DNA repair protein [Yersinia enterocolitica]|uniref:DNA repair protein n=1 Tax=Yersinia enterocolitica TaxID=630 RepID=A0A9P1V2X4_YEREN|nr:MULTISPECIES: DNA repair protein [Yersinia]AKF38204.1 DNA repair protein [Yersinia enterocolitica]ALG45209.1 DNA repair protein [Yersinia enterocolitica]EKN3337719.1 DNA repair protein [Yersinia enterocolitica]EKN3341330.1 DNA repair protein [Yersinia enterocolitica]EKN3384181.1 DNA repair protein [Yersinia enterocolitica]